MRLLDYYSLDGEHLCFSRSNSSAFAKRIAADFNPIHNVDARRFCVPGDLLFAVLLDRYGVCQSMQFEFVDMVVENTELVLPSHTGERFSLCDRQGKPYLWVTLAGDQTHDRDLVNELILRYARFSGRTFPHILVPLMRDNGVMVNPDRPLVIYKSMRIELQELAVEAIALELEDATMEVVGKKGEVSLRFAINAAGVRIGHGEKNMLLGGLLAYDQARIDTVVDNYMASRSIYIEGN